MYHSLSQVFCWNVVAIDPANSPEDTHVIRISLWQDVPLEIGELFILAEDENGEGFVVDNKNEIIESQLFSHLFDEPGSFPDRYTPLRNAYVQEKPYAAAAYEFRSGIYPSTEFTHPPLGKLITSLGIRIFGMNPFGWRAMPAMSGVLMLPLVYLLLCWMFGRMSVSVAGTLLFAFDFMHFVQTRISTLDGYLVFFILCMYVCIYRYITTPLDAPWHKTALPLCLCGLCFGLAISVTWQGLYAVLGILALFILYLIRKARYCRETGEKFMPFLWKTGVLGVLGFIVIPCAVYVSAYIPYAGTDPSPVAQMFWERYNPGAPVRSDSALAACLENQKFMLSWHTSQRGEHGSLSRWYQWLLDYKPIPYARMGRLNGQAQGNLLTVCMLNPLIAWAGLLALLFCGWAAFRRQSRTALFILLGYLSQLLPWALVGRVTFLYHYFPCVLFLCLALCYVLDRIMEKHPKRGRWVLWGFTGVSLGLFALFYPVLSGRETADWYFNAFIAWFPGIG